ncbi:MAG: hypothetical protein U9Q06_00885 [Nanoarchaeota archaeon]|nr:hypothetical protein [Nanoarchaeota archaeon]
MKYKNYYLILIFGLFLILFATLSSKVGFHDSYEYITMAKNLAGIKNLNVFSTHSMFYPAVISLFLKIWPTLTMIKLVNTFWLFAIGLVFLFWLKNKQAFLIFAFSPLTWFMSIQTTPVLPASFFLLLAYIFLKKDCIKYNKLYSGFFLGVCSAVYTPMILVSVIFILVYFWSAKISEVVTYLLVLSLGILPRFVLDFYLFGNPFYSFIRYTGTNILISMGINPTISSLGILNHFDFLLIFLVISPFLYKLIKLNFKLYRQDILFLVFAGGIILIRTANMKYFMLFSPIIILLLSNILTKKEIKLHCLISIILIIILTFSFFGITKDKLIQEDIDKIAQEFMEREIIGGPFEGNKLATFLWEDEPKIIWFMDFEAGVKNKSSLKKYSFEINKNKNTREILEISVDFKRLNNLNYENYIIVSENKEEMLKRFELIKCYETLCVYQ